MEQPDSPNVPASEPEQEREVVDYVSDMLESDGVEILVSLAIVRDYLLDCGLDVDDEGFIVDAETGEYAAPYAYDWERLRTVPVPVEDPLDAFFVPETEAEAPIIGVKERIHLSDLHALGEINGKHRPIRDNTINLTKLVEDLGHFFQIVTQWSDNTIDDFYEAFDIGGEKPMKMVWKKEGNYPLRITCFGCDFRGRVSEWDGEMADPICPECGGHWNTRGRQYCKACGEMHFKEELEFVGEGMMAEAVCPDCNSVYHPRATTDRYDT